MDHPTRAEHQVGVGVGVGVAEVDVDGVLLGMGVPAVVVAAREGVVGDAVGASVGETVVG